MDSVIYLKVGEIDLSKFCNEGDFSIDRDAVFDSESDFTNVYGETEKKLLGHSVKIGLNFVGMESSVAAELETALRGSKIQVEYQAPNRGSGEFYCSTFKFTIEDIVAGETYYSGSLSLVCDLMPCEGL